MSSRKTTVFYGLLIGVASLAVGMVIASRLDLSPPSMAQQAISAPATNSAPLSGPVDASTFRNIAKVVSPSVVNIRTESRQRATELTEFFGGDDLFERFFGGQPGRGQGQAKANSSGRASRLPLPPAPVSSSARMATSSPTTTSSKARPKSRSSCTGTRKSATRRRLSGEIR